MFSNEFIICEKCFKLWSVESGRLFSVFTGIISFTLIYQGPMDAKLSLELEGQETEIELNPYSDSD